MRGRYEVEWRVIQGRVLDPSDSASVADPCSDEFGPDGAGELYVSKNWISSEGLIYLLYV